MAGFLLNNCTYPDCRKKFPTLSDLIYHIEEDHLDFSPSIIEEKERQKVQYIALSYVLRYSHLFYRVPEIKDNVGSSKKAITPKFEPDRISDHDPVLIESEVSDDSWNDDWSNEFCNYSRRSLDNGHSHKEEFSNRTKKFACPVPGCNKRYKNINGIKYHTRNSHQIRKSPIKQKKMYKCHCGKSYKTIQGLKAHSISHREVNFSFHKIYNQHLQSQKFPHPVNPYIQHSEMVKNSCIKRADIVDDEVVSYSYVNSSTKLGDSTDYEHNTNGHFGFFASPAYGNTVEGSSNNLVVDESINPNYQYTLTYRKY